MIDVGHDKVGDISELFIPKTVFFPVKSSAFRNRNGHNSRMWEDTKEPYGLCLTVN